MHLMSYFNAFNVIFTCRVTSPGYPPNGVDVQNIQDYANQLSLRTSSCKTFGAGAAIFYTLVHLPVLEVTKDD